MSGMVEATSRKRPVSGFDAVPGSAPARQADFFSTFSPSSKTAAATPGHKFKQNITADHDGFRLCRLGSKSQTLPEFSAPAATFPPYPVPCSPVPDSMAFHDAGTKPAEGGHTGPSRWTWTTHRSGSRFSIPCGPSTSENSAIMIVMPGIMPILLTNRPRADRGQIPGCHPHDHAANCTDQKADHCKVALAQFVGQRPGDQHAQRQGNGADNGQKSSG